MYKKLLSFILILCMCMSINTNVYAHETIMYDSEEASAVYDSEEASAVYDSEEASTVYDSEDVIAVYDSEDTCNVEEILIPQNGSKVNMESQQMLFSLRDNDDGDTQERYNVLVLDTSSATRFVSNGTTIYTADTALPYVKKASKKFIEDISKLK